jgi:hypothetical protein
VVREHRMPLPLCRTLLTRRAGVSDTVARGSTRITVNRYIANSVGSALMSVILTKQFNRSESISTANALAILRGNVTKRGTPHDPSAVSRQGLAPDFTSL